MMKLLAAFMSVILALACGFVMGTILEKAKVSRLCKVDGYIGGGCFEYLPNDEKPKE